MVRNLAALTHSLAGRINLIKYCVNLLDRMAILKAPGR
jgi:hypothetical protein